MFIGRVEISREGYIGNGYGKADPSKPFLAKIEVFGTRTKTEMVLSPELSARVVALVADEIAAAGRATADAMVAEAMDVTALPAPAPQTADENLPF
jgi:hypothetical protein